jgi:hypothetical protein
MTFLLYRRPEMENTPMNKHRNVRRILLMAATLAAMGIVHRAQAIAPAVRAVVLSGQPAPGTPSGVVYRDFNQFYFSLNDAGQVAFLGYLTGPDVGGFNEGIWSEGYGSLALVAREGDHPPDTSEFVRFDSLAFTVLNNSGQVAFWSRVHESFITSGTGIWAQRLGALSLVARDGTEAPGTVNNVSFAGFAGPVLNDSGRTAFRGGVAGDDVDNTNAEGIWSEGLGSLALVARRGNQAIGLPIGTNYDTLGLPSLNDAGQTAFYGYFAEGSTASSFGQAIWSEGSGNLALVTRSGNQAAGTPNTTKFVGFSDPSLNNNGQTAFWAYVNGSNPDVGEPYDDGIWSQGSGGLTLVARRGNPAPGTQAGVNFGSEQLLTFDSLVLSDSGNIAFRAFISGPGVDELNHEGIWSGETDSPQLLARSGSHAPGTPAGVNFETFFAWNGALQMNGLGQSVFTAFLTGDEVVFGNRIGLWATDIAGALHLIARTGDSLEVAPGDIRTIIDLSFVADGSGGSDGRARGINDRGQIVFWAKFIGGGEGIFVSSLVAVPEPASLALAALGLPFIFWRQSRRCSAVIVSTNKSLPRAETHAWLT